VLPAAALLVGVAIVSVQRGLERTASSGLARAVAASVFLLAVGAYVVIEHDYLWRTNARTLNRQVYPANPFVEAEDIGRYLRNHTSPDDRIAVLGSEPEIYFYSGRRAATGYIYTYALMERQRYASRMQHEMIEEIEAAHPAYLVFVRSTLSWLALREEEPILQWADRYINRCYDRVGVADVSLSEHPDVRWDDAAAREHQPSDNTILTYRRKNVEACSATP
jgi:hypothetical protein